MRKKKYGHQQVNVTFLVLQGSGEKKNHFVGFPVRI